jgi:hypothetical protein
VSIPEPRPEKVASRANPVILTREAIAEGQLESAILLWFLEKDIVSIHTLAVAASEVLNGIGSKQGKPTIIGRNLKRLPKSQQKRLTKAQNFFKHASTDPNMGLRFAPELSELVMYDAVRSFGKIFRRITPLMRAFAARFCISWGDALGKVVAREGIQESFPIDKFVGIGRKQFLQQALRFFIETD